MSTLHTLTSHHDQQAENDGLESIEKFRLILWTVIEAWSLYSSTKKALFAADILQASTWFSQKLSAFILQNDGDQNLKDVDVDLEFIIRPLYVQQEVDGTFNLTIE